MAKNREDTSGEGTEQIAGVCLTDGCGYEMRLSWVVEQTVDGYGSPTVDRVNSKVCSLLEGHAYCNRHACDVTVSKDEIEEFLDEWDDEDR